MVLKIVRRVAIAVVGLAAVAAGVLGAEVLLARSGNRLPDRRLTYPGSGGRSAVWIGDSTAVGVGVDDGGQAVASVVAAERGHRVRMLAVSGAQLDEVLADQLPQVSVSEPDVVFVSVGANDVTHLTSARAFRRDYDQLLRGLPAGVPVVALGVPDMGAVPRFAQPLRSVAAWRGRVLDREIRAAARAAGATYVDIAGGTGPRFRADPERYFADDRYHPSDEGYALWAQVVLGEGVP